MQDNEKCKRPFCKNVALADGECRKHSRDTLRDAFGWDDDVVILLGDDTDADDYVSNDRDACEDNFAARCDACCLTAHWVVEIPRSGTRAGNGRVSGEPARFRLCSTHGDNVLLADRKARAYPIGEQRDRTA